jgi:1-hydroxy-2-isopentenylcarotenoid 3,4-desaturase
MSKRDGGRLVVVGAGIGGMAAAARLARDGFDVTVVERNDQAGGRARIWQKDGYTFDMGPSWYLMPEVFERFFAGFGKKTEDYYQLKQLDPSYRVFFGRGEAHDVPPDRAGVAALFDRLEPGGGAKLGRYLDDAAYKYKVAVGEFLYREYRSIFDFLNGRMMTEGLKLNVLGKLDAAVRKQFGDRRARQILEYAMVFLGTSPNDAPAMYALMSHVDLTQGVFYPLGGLSAVAQGIRRLAEEQGVKFLLGTEATHIVTERGRAVRVEARGADGAAVSLPCEAVVANADYAHVETELLEAADCSYPKKYWDGRVVAPSMFLLYLGVKRRLEKLAHHNLYFQADWNIHFDTIFKRPAWPEETVLLRVVHHEDRSGDGAAGAGERVRAGAGGGGAGGWRRGARGLCPAGGPPRGADDGRGDRAAHRDAADLQPPRFRGGLSCVEGNGAGDFAHADADGGVPAGDAEPEGEESLFRGTVHASGHRRADGDDRRGRGGGQHPE